MLRMLVGAACGLAVLAAICAMLFGWIALCSLFVDLATPLGFGVTVFGLPAIGAMVAGAWMGMDA